MKANSVNSNIFDHLEAAQKLNKAILYRCDSRGKMSREWFISMASAQARNLKAIKEMLERQPTDNSFAEIEALQDALKKGEDFSLKLYRESEQASPKTSANVVQVEFGTPFRGGKSDG